MEEIREIDDVQGWQAQVYSLAESQYMTGLGILTANRNTNRIWPKPN